MLMIFTASSRRRVKIVVAPHDLPLFIDAMALGINRTREVDLVEYAAPQDETVIHGVSVMEGAHDLSQLIDVQSGREHCAREVDGRENTLIQNEPVRSVCIIITS